MYTIKRPKLQNSRPGRRQLRLRVILFRNRLLPQLTSPRGSGDVVRSHAAISHIDFLEGERSAFPLPTFASLPASPSRALLCDQRGHPPWNPPDLLAQIKIWLDSLLALLFEVTCPLVAHTDFSAHHPPLLPRRDHPKTGFSEMRRKGLGVRKNGGLKR